MIWKYLLPVAMLAGANVLVNVAWFGHLKVPDRALWLAVLASWGIAFVEYCLVVPAMRLGSTVYSLPELKTIQVTFSILMFSRSPGGCSAKGRGQAPSSASHSSSPARSLCSGRPWVEGGLSHWPLRFRKKLMAPRQFSARNQLPKPMD